MKKGRPGPQWKQWPEVNKAGITGDITERIAPKPCPNCGLTYCDCRPSEKAMAASQPDIDKVIHDQIESKLEASAPKYLTRRYWVVVENIPPTVRHEYRIANAICEGATAVLRQRFQLSQHPKINVVVMETSLEDEKKERPQS